METVPKDLTALEYARHILEFELCWPSKSNIEMIADCITSISKGKGLPLVKAYKYLARAILLAKEQSITVDRMFFLNGDYMNIRPPKPLRNDYEKVSEEEYARMKADREAYHQTPEYIATIARLNEMFGIKVGKKYTREEIKAQAEQIKNARIPQAK